MNALEIVDRIFNMTPNEGYEYLDANIDKKGKFTVKANGRTLSYVGLDTYKNTYRIRMERGNTGQHFLITSFKFAKRIRRKTWAQFTLYKRKKLTL